MSREPSRRLPPRAAGSAGEPSPAVPRAAHQRAALTWPRLGALAAWLCLASFACAEGSVREVLRAEFWADVQPVAGVGDEWPVSPATGRARILDEAAWVYGGMIWGFEFSYTPYDKTRGVAERFDLASIGGLRPELLTIAPGAAPRSADEYRSFVEFRPDASLAALMASYEQGPWVSCQGTGKADTILGVKGRRAAYEDGLREAVRSYLRSIEPNKPRLVRGRVAFERPPSMTILDGFYTVRLRARTMVVEIIPYKLY